MARSRNLKPGFFKNEHLGVLPPLTRLLFEALWCEADREGRLEDRPMRIKAEYFPYDDCDVDTMLAQLEHSAGMFIIRYSVDGKKYIQVVNFTKHQNPHKAEALSKIPPPPPEGKTEVKLNSYTSTIPAQCKHRTCMILAGLIPDSLIPDSKGKTICAEQSSPPADGIPYKEIIDHLNQTCNRQFRVVDSTREIIRGRWQEGFRLDDFKKVIDIMCAKWGKDPAMHQYLRPETLFRGSKFQGYLNSEVVPIEDNTPRSPTWY